MIRDFTASYIHLFMAGLQPEAQAWHSPSVINIPVTEYSACHNDLLADNFILINADALHKHASPMYIIDWEYAGMAPRYYDIGDMFQEILVPRE
ncbi:MAG: phosphotransferase, partial [Proteobacteria bacterium]|nr:phosphotransferase [Pseudomonadota bacterium]